VASKPVEQANLKWPFVVLSALLALSTVWAVYDEVVARRPWKGFQREFFALRLDHARADLKRAERRLEGAEEKSRLEAARSELLAAQQAMTGSPEQRKAYDAIVAAEEKARQVEAEAKLLLGFEKSESDAIYYLVREARREDQEGGALQARLEATNRKVDEKAKVLAEARQAHQKATEARLAYQKRLDDARASVDQIRKPVEEMKKKLAAYSSFTATIPDMEQYWIPGLPNSWGSDTVDRCHTCHAAIDRAGFSAPAEVLEAKKAGMAPSDLKIQFVVDDEVVEAYQVVHDRICEELALPSPAIPIGGNPPVAAPAPVDPAQATECRPAAAYRKWLAMSAAYCASGQRWLARTRFVLKDRKGAAIVRDPKRRGPRAQDFAHPGRTPPSDDELAGVAQACAARTWSPPSRRRSRRTSTTSGRCSAPTPGASSCW
jgi:hypothetical protein